MKRVFQDPSCEQMDIIVQKIFEKTTMGENPGPFSSPIFAPIALGLSRFANADEPPSIDELNNILRLEDIRFVAQTEKSFEFAQSYEPRIYLKGEIQTRRQSWHDFFNALVWQQFPLTKKVINRLQYELQSAHYPAKSRSPAENMLTLFDENGAIVIAKDASWLNLIREHRWHELFWQRRDRIMREMRVIVFGHGLYEKAMQPYVGLTAKCLLFIDEEIGDIDASISYFLSRKSAELRTQDLNPLPILGLPGWWPENANEAFYQNKSYFREKGTVLKSGHA